MELEDLFLPLNCDEKIVAKRGDGTRTQVTGQDGTAFPVCCYEVDKIAPDPTAECVVGRPFKEAGSNRVATIRLHGDLMAEAWTRAAEVEHSSVAAFARLSLQLMACGAPLELLADTLTAALDEVRHVRACLDMAERCGARDITLERFPFTLPVAVMVSLAELATESLLDGCINETLGAFAAREAARLCPDPVVRKTLQLLAEDEARHATLAYRIVKWALDVGGVEVRDALVKALASPAGQVNTAELAMRTGIPAEILSEVQSDGMHRVVGPAVSALLAA